MHPIRQPNFVCLSPLRDAAVAVCIAQAGTTLQPTDLGSQRCCDHLGALYANRMAELHTLPSQCDQHHL